MVLCPVERCHFCVEGSAHCLHGKAEGVLSPSFLAVPNNRIRSPWLEASSRWHNVDKGSRQNRRVTSGKALALRAGSGRPARRQGHREVFSTDVGPRGLMPVDVPPYLSLSPGSRLGGKQPTWNCRGQGESNCLIKTKLRDGS